MKISLTRALTLVKNSQARIQQQIAGSMYIGLMKNDKPTAPSFASKADMTTRIEGDFKSVEDQLKNLSVLKAAISKANEETTLTINGKEYNINGAIFLKKTVELRRMHLNQARHALAANTQMVMKSEEKATMEVQSALNTMFGSEKNRASLAANTELQASAEAAVRNLHQLQLHDPLKLEAKIIDMQKEIDVIEGEIDFALSEINARTEIEVAI